METKLKQRVIGALVITALLIIFLPAFFKGSSNAPAPVTITEQIPPAPPKPTAPVPDKLTSKSRVQDLQQSELELADNSGDTKKSVFSENAQHPTTTKIAKTEKVKDSSKNPPVVSVAASEPSDSSSADSSMANTLNSSPESRPNRKIMGMGGSTSQDHPKTNKAEQLALANQVSSIEKQALVENQTITKQKNVVAKKTEVDPVVPKKSLAATSPAVKKAPAPSLAADTPPARKPQAHSGTAWVVQLGSFSDNTNAKQLVQQLKGHGFTAYCQKAKSAKGDMTRVLVGPETQRTQAQAVLDKMHKEMSLKGVIVAYAPLQGNKE